MTMYHIATAALLTECCVLCGSTISNWKFNMPAVCCMSTLLGAAADRNDSLRSWARL